MVVDQFAEARERDVLNLAEEQLGKECLAPEGFGAPSDLVGDEGSALE